MESDNGHSICTGVNNISRTEQQFNYLFYFRMSSFPPRNWQVRHLEDMDSYEPTPANTSRLYMEALLAARPAGGHEGMFRLAIAGDEKLTISMKVTDIFNSKEVQGMTVVADIPNGSLLKLRKNSCTSKWTDIEELVKSQDADVLNEEGEDVSEEFLDAWDNIRRSHPLGDKLGAVWRWAVTAIEGSTDMEVVVQALPVNINHVKTCSELRQVNRLKIGNILHHYDSHAISSFAALIEQNTT